MEKKSYTAMPKVPPEWRALRDGDGGALGGAERERGRKALDLSRNHFQTLHAPRQAVISRACGRRRGPAAHAGAGETAPAGHGEAAGGEPEAAAEGGHHGPDLGGGEWPPPGAHRPGEPQ